jgi:recombinational DNA repair protein RecT
MTDTAVALATKAEVVEKSNEIRLAAQLPAKYWPDERIRTIAKNFAPEGTSVPELAMFLTVAHKYDLDPIVNEIWLSYDKKKGRLIVLTGRDAYLKIAMRDPGYGGINSGIVYEKDTFRQIKTGNGEVQIEHEINSLNDRGKITGAYCVAYHDKRVPVTVIRTWAHYQKLHSRPTWISNPDDMMETRVIVAALRRQYNISGLYTDAEFPNIDGEKGGGPELENVLVETSGRVQELREQIEQMRAKEAEEEEEIEEASFEMVPQEHGPVSVGVDAVIVEDGPPDDLFPEDAPEPAEESQEVEEAQAEERAKLHKKYMARWKDVVGGPAGFRRRWQKNAVGKESTKEWSPYDYETAIELLAGDDWSKYVVSKK